MNTNELNYDVALEIVRASRAWQSHLLDFLCALLTQISNRENTILH